MAIVPVLAVILNTVPCISAFEMVGRTLKMNRIIALTLAASVTIAPRADAFHAPSGWTRSSTALFAKASKKKKKKAPSTASSGGFGKTATVTTTTKEGDDYEAFPALDSQVQETIVQFDGVPKEQGEELPDEMYQRLDQIYGFHNFNYLEEEEQDSASLGDLLSSSPSGEPEPINAMSDLLKPSSVAADFTDLLGTKSAGGVSSESSSAELPCLSSLPPFTDFNVLHVDPLVISIDNFFTGTVFHREDRFIP